MFRETIEHRIADAMKTDNKTELAVWRAIKNEFLIYKTAKAGNELTDAVELKLIQKCMKNRGSFIVSFGTNEFLYMHYSYII